MGSVKIFGREPTLIIGFLGAAITVLAAMKMPWLSAGQAAAGAAFLSAIVIALTTRPVAPAAFVAAFTAVAALFAQYGLHWSDALIGGVSGLILAGFSLAGIRPQVTPGTTSQGAPPASG